jgi:hypothetical protein
VLGISRFTAQKQNAKLEKDEWIPVIIPANLCPAISGVKLRFGGIRCGGQRDFRVERGANSNGEASGDALFRSAQVRSAISANVCTFASKVVALA